MLLKYFEYRLIHNIFSVYIIDYTMSWLVGIVLILSHVITFLGRYYESTEITSKVKDQGLTCICWPPYWHWPTAGTGTEFLPRAGTGTWTSPYWHSLSKIDPVPIRGQFLIEVETYV